MPVPKRKLSPYAQLVLDKFDEMEAAMPLKPELTQEEFERIDRALFSVLDNPADFGDWLADFAAQNVERLEKYGRRTAWSEKQWEVVGRIERIQRGDEAPQDFNGSR